MLTRSRLLKADDEREARSILEQKCTGGGVGPVRYNLKHVYTCLPCMISILKVYRDRRPSINHFGTYLHLVGKSPFTNNT